jgi:hypothetical protein
VSSTVLNVFADNDLRLRFCVKKWGIKLQSIAVPIMLNVAEMAGFQGSGWRGRVRLAPTPFNSIGGLQTADRVCRDPRVAKWVMDDAVTFRHVPKKPGFDYAEFFFDDRRHPSQSKLQGPRPVGEAARSGWLALDA